jgi:hypothetical protein
MRGPEEAAGRGPGLRDVECRSFGGPGGVPASETWRISQPGQAGTNFAAKILSREMQSTGGFVNIIYFKSLCVLVPLWRKYSIRFEKNLIL